MNIGIAGLGTIGLKLTEYLADKGFKITAYGRNIDLKKRAFEQILEDKLKANKLTVEEASTVKNRILFTDKITDFGICDLIIESLKELYELKISFLEDLHKVFPDKIVASTTSSLDLYRLAEHYNPKQLIGLHFFNPPMRMKLIELSFLSETPQKAKNLIYEFTGMLKDKIVIELPFIQGYIANNLLLAYINHSVEFYQANDLNKEDIDNAMKLGTNMPMGPLELADYIGNDIVLEILVELYSATQDLRFKPSTMLIEMVANKKLGRKSKSGFYNY